VITLLIKSSSAQITASLPASPAASAPVPKSATRDNGGTETDPYFEGALTYRVSRQTDVRWVHPDRFHGQ
jgi:hypothetical protein